MEYTIIGWRENLTSEEEGAYTVVKAIIDGRVARKIHPAGCPDNEAYAAGASVSSVSALVRYGILRTKRMLNGNMLFIV